VSDRTLAQLSLQGVTGLLYIDLQQEKVAGATQRIMTTVPSDRYPVIRSVRSNLDTFVSSLPDITEKLADLVVRASSILSEQNVAAISNVIANLDKAGNELPNAARNIGALLADLRSAVGDSRDVIRQLQQTANSGGPNLSIALDRLRVTAENMATASQKLDSVIADNRDDLRNFTRDSLPQFDALVRDARQAAQEFSQLSRSLRSNPAQLLYQAPPRGVEIPK
jgi:phospholipid/cholesterol/gamma-HCH transport system substrate-binding protein